MLFLGQVGAARKLNGANLPTHIGSRGFCWHSTESEQDIVLKLESVAVIALTKTASREAARDVVVGDPYLVVTIAQVHGIDEIQLWSDVFAYRQTCGRHGFSGNETGLDPNLT